ncbi:hypothetical protein GGTG_10114 [Gaeumannomyces tritici R3-111a-1]|uniref:SesA protein n=1 Tax=Gaeumannomyces tritici (strain R3-111a-1) TaxID=644352 RepID=J3P9D1_GAET3|nr:hypothetical protein GGTG_10114 [Gaeumannomyces tritici R3-111a-1]EJT73267.1 hypothetical protein GGTG_10114 [Gaeumannomyces tritici R3-111a-1]
MADTVSNLFADTISAVEAAANYYSSVNNDKSLREAFHEAGRGQGLVRQALQAANLNLGGRKPTEKTAVLVEACRTKAKLSEGIFKEAAQAPEGSGFDRYKAAVEQNKGSTVEVLTVGMMKGICELAEDDAMKAAMETLVMELRDAVAKLSKMEPSMPTEEAGHNFTNFTNRGRDQINAPSGTVNRSEGAGNHFPGATFSGSVSFGN